MGCLAEPGDAALIQAWQDAMNAPAHKSVFQMLKDTVSAWMNDRALNLSAALAYYSIFSIAPLLIIAISIAGLAVGPEAVQGKLDDELRKYIGAQAAEGVQSLVKSAAKPGHGWIGAITGFVTLLIGASGVFGQLKEALNTIWKVKQKPGAGIRGFLRERLLSFGMVLVIGFLLLVSLLLTSAVAAISTTLNHFLGLPEVVWASVSFFVSLSVVTTLFALIFKVLPDAKVEWRDVWTGAVATGLLFELGKFGLGYYLGRESTASSYGAAGSVILLLLWIYFASCILLLGAEFTRVYAQAHGRTVLPAENAEPAAPATENATPAPKHEPPMAPAAVPQFAKPAPPGNQMGRILGIAGVAFLVGKILGRKKSVADPLGGEWVEVGRATGESIATLLDQKNSKS